MEIQLSNPKDVVIVKEQKKTIEKVTVLEIVDLPSRKQVIAKTQELGSVMLWKDAEYDTVGQWTDTDVVNKLNELYNS
jgi:hypothetical protein